MNSRTEAKLTDLSGMQKAIEEILKQAWERGRKYGQNARSQGEWIDYDNTFYKCPDCGYLLEKCCPRCQNEVILPNCGAKLEVRKNDK